MITVPATPGLLPPNRLEEERSSPQVRKDLEIARGHFGPDKLLESGQLDDWVDILLCTCKELVAYRNLYLLCEGDADDGANDKCGEGTRSGTLGILTRVRALPET